MRSGQGRPGQMLPATSAIRPSSPVPLVIQQLVHAMRPGCAKKPTLASPLSSRMRDNSPSDAAALYDFIGRQLRFQPALPTSDQPTSTTVPRRIAHRTFYQWDWQPPEKCSAHLHVEDLGANSGCRQCPQQLLAGCAGFAVEYRQYSCPIRFCANFEVRQYLRPQVRLGIALHHRRHRLRWHVDDGVPLRASEIIMTFVDCTCPSALLDTQCSLPTSVATRSSLCSQLQPSGLATPPQYQHANSSSGGKHWRCNQAESPPPNFQGGAGAAHACLESMVALVGRVLVEYIDIASQHLVSPEMGNISC